jgi:tellurite resistance-related uncharacterized protein
MRDWRVPADVQEPSLGSRGENPYIDLSPAHFEDARPLASLGMKFLPTSILAYKRTPEFTERTVPAGLLRSHQTKDGVWGKIVVLEGSLLYRILEPAVEEILLSPDRHGVVEPTVRHEVVPSSGVRFFVEFHR